MSEWNKFANLLREEASHWAEGCQAQMALEAVAKIADEMGEPVRQKPTPPPKSPVVYRVGNYTVEEQANGQFGIFGSGGGSIGSLFHYPEDAKAEADELHRLHEELGT